jgi:hypothetical protein
MGLIPGWLPSIVDFDNFGGNWNSYIDYLYAIFTKDFIDTAPLYCGQRCGCKKGALEQGKVPTFWHLISEGQDENSRTPDIRRCERVPWPRPIIENNNDSGIKIWKNRRRRGETRICLWIEPADYLVILAERKGYVLLWTAYPVTHPSKRAKLEKEYQAHKKANAV